MTRKLTVSVSNVLALAIVAGLMTLFIWLFLPSFAESASSNGNSGYLRRYAANFAAWDGTEIQTDQPPPGILIYNKNFFVADDINTLYVGISATGDDHDGRRLQLRCEVDGQPCNPGTGGAGGAPAGWFSALRFDNYNDDYTGTGYGGDGGGGSGDVHDNVVTYTWCTPFETKAGTHNVQIRLASGPNPDGDDPAVNNFVFLENVFFYVDGARVADETDACTPNAVESEVAVAASTTTAPDGSLIDTTTFVPLTGPTSLDTALTGDHADK
jgi:hypothetical protein